MSTDSAHSSVDLGALQDADDEIDMFDALLETNTRLKAEVASLQADLEHTRQIVAAQAEVVEAARTLMRTARSAALHPGPFVAPFNEFVGLDQALARLDGADVPGALLTRIGPGTPHDHIRIHGCYQCVPLPAGLDAADAPEGSSD